MKRNHLMTLIAAAALALTISHDATAQTARPTEAANPGLSGFLTELAEMIKSGAPDSIIRAEIEKQEKLTVSARQLALLKTTGANDNLLQLVYKRSGAPETNPRQQPASYERSLPSCRPTTPLKLRVGIEPFDYGTCCTHLLSRGFNVEQVRDWIGHEKIQNTMIYARVTNSRRDEMAKALTGW